MKQDRDTQMHLDTDGKRRDRQSFVDEARPQWGVDTMRDDFVGTTPIPGVVDQSAG